MDPTGGTVRVLLVDDDEDVAATAASFLEQERAHFEVVTAPDATAGLDVLADQSVDCVVSDYNMPGTNGLAFLDRVRADHGDLPFVLFTGEGSEALASEAISAGVTDYVRKAVGTEQYALLANRIDRAVEAHRSQAALAERTQRLETLISNLPGIVYRCANDPTWPMEFVAGECEQLTGYPASALEDGDVLWGEDVVHPDDRGEIWEAVQNALDAGGPFEVTYRIRTRRGETRWVWERGRGLSSDGELDAMEGFITDVTASRKRERRIERLQRRTRRLIDTTTRAETAQVAVDTAHEVLDAELCGFHLLTEDGLALDPVAWADTVCEEFGEPPVYDRETDDPAAELVWDAFDRGEPVVVDDAREYGRLAEMTPTRSGVVHPLADHGVFIVSATEPGAFDDTDLALVEILVASLRAALDRVEREIRLREREAELETERDRLRALFDMVPDPIAHVRFEGGEPILIDVNPAFEETFGYDAGTVAGESNNDLVVPPERREEAERIDQEALTGGAVTREVRRRTADGTGDFLFRSVPVGEDETADEYYGIYVDISEQKDAERRLERQNERLAEFAEVVSHDLRNPLNVAQGRVELLQDHYDDEHLDATMRAHERMAALIEDILYLAREGGTVGDVEPIALAETAAGCWQNVETADADLVVDTDCSVLADRGQFQRLLENLLGNAVEHGGPDVTVTVGDVADGFFVADDGPGIDEETRERLFDAGYSTSPEGTGFGLAIVQRVAEGHGWDVTVTDSDDGGVSDEDGESEARETASPGARFEVTGVETVSNLDSA